MTLHEEQHKELMTAALLSIDAGKAIIESIRTVNERLDILQQFVKHLAETDKLAAQSISLIAQNLDLHTRQISRIAIGLPPNPSNCGPL